VGLNIHLTDCCSECWKSWFDYVKHKAEFLGTSVGWDLRSSSIVPVLQKYLLKHLFGMVAFDWVLFFCLCRYLSVTDHSYQSLFDRHSSCVCSSYIPLIYTQTHTYIHYINNQDVITLHGPWCMYICTLIGQDQHTHQHIHTYTQLGKSYTTQPTQWILKFPQHTQNKQTNP